MKVVSLPNTPIPARIFATKLDLSILSHRGTDLLPSQNGHSACTFLVQRVATGVHSRRLDLQLPGHCCSLGAYAIIGELCKKINFSVSIEVNESFATDFNDKALRKFSGPKNPG